MATVIVKYKMNTWGHKIVVLENLKMNSVMCEGNEAGSAYLRCEYYDSSQHCSIFYAYATIIY